MKNIAQAFILIFSLNFINAASDINQHKYSVILTTKEIIATIIKEADSLEDLNNIINRLLQANKITAEIVRKNIVTFIASFLKKKMGDNFDEASFTHFQDLCADWQTPQNGEFSQGQYEIDKNNRTLYLRIWEILKSVIRTCKFVALDKLLINYGTDITNLSKQNLASNCNIAATSIKLLNINSTLFPLNKFDRENALIFLILLLNISSKDMSIATKNGISFAIATAIETSNLELLKLIIKKRNPYLENNFHDRNLIIAIIKNKCEIAELLLNAGVDPNYQSYLNMEAAIIIAAEYNNINMVKLLLKYGAKRDLRDEHDNTALNWAEIHRNVEMIVLLTIDL